MNVKSKVANFLALRRLFCLSGGFVVVEEGGGGGGGGGGGFKQL